MKGITDEEFRQLSDYVRENYGLNLPPEKRSLLVGRLQNILLQNGFESFSEYYQYLLEDKTGEGVKTLLNKLTTNYTFFLREPEHFNYLRQKILPTLKAACAREKDLRIWCAGCATGEEAYTIAMFLDEYFGLDKNEWDTKILAVDISTKSLETAIKGIYFTEQLANLPESWLRKYFRKIDQEKSIVVDRLRNEIIFRTFNLMNDVFPFKKKFHLIFCRNVMIYFDTATKIKLVEKFYQFTEPGGYLFIGHSESLNREETKYKYILPAIYKKE